MSIYVMSDIHGCYSLMQEMLHKIGFSSNDRLIIAGDCIDRGKEQFEILQFMKEHSEKHTENIKILRGNHEEEFIQYVGKLQSTMEECSLDINQPCSLREAYEKTSNREKQAMRRFDPSGTIKGLIDHNVISMSDLICYSRIMKMMPYYYVTQINGRRCIVVHAGYIGSEDMLHKKFPFCTLKDFYIYAREEAYEIGGIEHGMVIAGHTPTISLNHKMYNHGNVFRLYDEEKDCVFYDIDCGAAFKGRRPGAKLACIRLEDEEIFYV